MDRPPIDREVSGARPCLAEGRLLAGRFEIRRRIGAGDSGEVFAAFDRERHAEIAIKVLLPSLVGDGRTIPRITRETALVAQLTHPGIGRVFEVLRDGNLHFITMELLRGVTLRHTMDKALADGQHVPVDEVVRLGIDLSDAVGHAHRQTVHGGIRPEHVFLCDDGKVKLIGLDGSRLLDLRQSTMIGIAKGAAGYFAPEQLKGSEDIDHRTDQYAVAAILYELLTGGAPVGRVKSVCLERPDTPLALSQALDRAMEVDPADRFADMETFAAALIVRDPTGMRRRRLWIVAAVILLAGVLGASFTTWRGPVGSMLRTAMHSSATQAAAESARAQATDSAAEWRKLARILPDGLSPGGASRADEAMLAGNEHYEARAYARAEKSYQDASALYQSLLEAATRMFREEPSRVAESAGAALAELDKLEQQLSDRFAEASRQLKSCERSLRSARTDGERETAEARRRDAEAERNLFTRLKPLVSEHVLSAVLREEIIEELSQADRQLEAAQHREALSSYAKSKARLDELLAWPEQAAGALREHLALSRRIELVRSALGPAAQESVGVQETFDEAAAIMALADDELTSGRIPEAVRLLESAQRCLGDVKSRAAADLLSRARTYDSQRRGTAAFLALNELLALEPGNVEALDLKRRVLAYRLTNSIGMELVFLPPGDFMMGTPPDEPGRDDDERQRHVILTTGFYMGATEVTQSQWFAVMGNNPSKFKGDDLPVERVSWEDALEFCRRLSGLEGQQYRLPMETEWEYACRAGRTAPFSFGERISTDQANYAGDKALGDGTEEIFHGKAVPVGSFSANAWGLFDMHGNVWEWCPDGYEYYRQSPPRASAKPALIVGRVLRGGSWRTRPRYCRCANRVRYTEDSELDGIGLRVVLEKD